MLREFLCGCVFVCSYWKERKLIMAICLRLLRMGKVGRGVGWGVGRMGLFRSCSSNNVVWECVFFEFWSCFLRYVDL